MLSIHIYIFSNSVKCKVFSRPLTANSSSLLLVLLLKIHVKVSEVFAKLFTSSLMLNLPANVNLTSISTCTYDISKVIDKLIKIIKISTAVCKRFVLAQEFRSR